MKKAMIILFAAFTCNAYAQCNSEPYTIQFEIIESSNGQAVLVIDLKLAEGSHYVSPYSSDRFSGRFGVDFAKDAELALDGSFTETPRSFEMYDPHPFVKAMVNWVRVDTRYEYPLKINANGDFETVGMVRFTIEPRCTFEQIPFVIKRKAGKLTIDRNAC